MELEKEPNVSSLDDPFSGGRVRLTPMMKIITKGTKIIGPPLRVSVQNTPISQWRRRKDLENLVALISAQLSLLPLILSLIFIRYKISFEMRACG